MHADHPRACGANFRPVSRGCSRFGSSPRVRGKRQDCRLSDSGGRIIPARAGQTHERKEMQKRASDHPRACGANDFLIAGANVGCGSSPRVRGKPVHMMHYAMPRRIIPARAGQTSCSARPAAANPDHPRACGANRSAGWWTLGTSGSSPRVRGKHLGSVPGHDSHRIIPARAGQTRTTGRPSPPATDHPRACGANV